MQIELRWEPYAEPHDEAEWGWWPYDATGRRVACRDEPTALLTWFCVFLGVIAPQPVAPSGGKQGDGHG